MLLPPVACSRAWRFVLPTGCAALRVEATHVMQSGRRRAAGAPPDVPGQCAAAQSLGSTYGLRRCAAAPGLLLVLVVIELVLVALHQTDMAAKTVLAGVMRLD